MTDRRRMPRSALAAGAVLGLLALLAAPADARIYEIDYARYDVRVTDSKGVVTDVGSFGFNTGPNILTCRRGDAYVEIAFRKIGSIEVGAYVPARGIHPCTVTLRTGRSFSVEIERIEGQRFMSGDTELGHFRIRLGQCSRLELRGLSQGDGLE